MKLLVINGANLNMLGKRDKEHYGFFTLDELNAAVKAYAKAQGVETRFFQSNSEGEIINALHASKEEGIILNAGAYSHYSYAIRDAVECISQPVVEVHLSDIAKREDFRKVRVLESVVKGCFLGKKENSYFEAVDFLVDYLKKQDKDSKKDKLTQDIL